MARASRGVLRRIRRSILFAMPFLWLPAGGALAVGEPVDGFPNWRERVVHEWINRARSDPQFEMNACGNNCAEKACYAPVAPLPWSLALNRAARFHSDEMLRQSYFAHDSRCTVPSNISSLYPDSCNGAASCACSGSGSTPWWQRIQYFGASPSGEIIASPSDPDFAFYLWLYEPSSTTSCTFTSANGHRWLILKASGSVGTGVSGPAVGDFGNGGTPARIPSGSHFPQQATTVDAWANWYDTAAPSTAEINVGGACIAMTLARGSATNGAYHAAVSGVGSGCHRYYFSFRDSSGVEVTYPTSGSLAIGSGASCPDWSLDRPAPCAAGATATATPTATATATATSAPPTATATRTPTPTGTPTRTPTATFTRSSTPTFTATVSPTPTPSVTPPATATPTSISPAAFGGEIRYFGSGSPVGGVGVGVLFVGGSTADFTGADGRYSVSVPPGSAEIRPSADLAESDAITVFDAVAAVSVAAHPAAASKEARLAADVSGNGIVTAYDAALILARAFGAATPFPVVQRCGWTTVYVPMVGPGLPVDPDVITCESGSSVVEVSVSGVGDVDFAAVRVGDVDGTWSP